MMKSMKRTGSTDPNLSAWQREHRLVAREAAAEGFVLLKNDGVLPLEQPGNVALFGAGARQTVKGGTGSGDVYAQENVTFEAGLKQAGFSITTSAWLDDFDRTYRRAKKVWSNLLLRNSLGKERIRVVQFYLSHPFQIPDGRLITPRDIQVSNTDTAIYVIARVAGEGSDRRDQKGDYQLTATEQANLKLIAAAYPKTIVVINTGGMIDLSFMDEIPGINALIYALQPGVEAGNALADLVCGAKSPSGKLTDTWAAKYADYPTARTFSHNDSDVSAEIYAEDIFVGYRYFDSYNVAPRYEFGFGLTYTNFSIQVLEFTCQDAAVTLTVSVTNTGARFSGKEVVQVYLSAPTGKLNKAYQSLAAFRKTRELAPGEAQVLSITFNLGDQASFDEERAAWILEKGLYTVRVGNSSRRTALVGYLELDGEAVIESTANICPPKNPIQKISFPEPEHETKDPAYPCLAVSPEAAGFRRLTHEKWDQKQVARAIVELLTPEELVAVVCGESNQGAETVGSASQSVPGAAGETTTQLAEKFGVANIILADGPAGLRLSESYTLTSQGKTYVKNALLSLLEVGPVVRKFLELAGLPGIKEPSDGQKYYQHTTAMPVGTLLAQTWNIELAEAVGYTVGQEMEDFEVTLWLAPGMNIHRDPLCGRNFEYFSEDPLLTGKMAAALTRGVQSRLPGLGTTLKHFACNNQEENRNYADKHSF